MSVFVVSVMSVVRWMTLCDLVPNPNRRSILLSFFSYLALQVGIASLPLLFSRKSPPIYFAPGIAACSWGLPDLEFLEYNSPQYVGVSYALIIVTWVLPAIPVFLCTVYIFTIIVKHRSRMRKYGKTSASCADNTSVTARLRQLSSAANQVSWSQRASAMSQASITIVLFAVTYVVFNVPIWLCILVIFLSIEDHVAFIGSSVYVNIFLSRLSVVMNASLNPLIYILRLSELRSDLGDLMALRFGRAVSQTVRNFSRSNTRSNGNRK